MVASVWDARTAGLMVLLVFAVLAAFAPILGNGFVNWDDRDNFLENPHYRGLGWAQIRWAWTTFHLGVYQPLAWMLLEAQYATWGLDPRGYHLTSLLLHVANTLVLYVLTRALLERCRPEWAREHPGRFAVGTGLAVALFAVHPLRTEAVAWASCQPYLPCALFFMLAILAYLRAVATPSSPRWWLAVAWLLFAAALLSKAAAVSLLAVLLVLDVYPLRRLGGGPGRWLGASARRVWWEKVPFAALSLAFMALAIAAKEYARTLIPIEHAGISSRVAQACYGSWFYVVKTVLPWGITAYYPLPRRVDWWAPAFLVSLVGAAGVGVGLFLLRRRWPGLVAGVACYLIVLGPHLGLVRIGHQIAADRYSYLASLCGMVVLAGGLCRLGDSGRWARPRRVAMTLVGVGLVLVLTVLTWRQVRTWRNSEALWTHALAHGAGQDPLVHNNLGLALADQGRGAEAIPHFAEALRLRPDLVEAHSNLGAVFYCQGKLDEAVACFAEALRLRPDHAEAHGNLGVILADQGKLDEAVAQDTEALRLRPDYAEAHNNLGAALYRQGRRDEALAHYTEALRLRPDYAEARYNLGAALARQGQLAEAVAQYAEALRLKPDLAEAHYDLGVALASQGKHEEAVAQYAEAVRLRPNYAEARHALGLASASRGRRDEAVAQGTEALRLLPDNAMVRRNLEDALLRKEDQGSTHARVSEAQRPKSDVR